MRELVGFSFSVRVGDGRARIEEIEEIEEVKEVKEVKEVNIFLIFIICELVSSIIRSGNELQCWQQIETDYEDSL